MATVMLVADIHAGQPVLGPDAAQRLGRLGVTHIALLRVLSSTAIVLEGWAFDPGRASDAVRAVFPDGIAGLRTFHEVSHVGVSPAHPETI